MGTLRILAEGWKLKWYKSSLEVECNGKGLYDMTAQIMAKINAWGINEGICHLFVQHTSASLVISESYDPSARRDLEVFMDHLVPENQAWFQHTLEGLDDSPSHMRSILTHTSLSIPIDKASLNLGTWQGIYLFEHRNRRQKRKVLIRCLSNDESIVLE